jgi:tRNA(Ile)-lysidine synthase
MGLIECLASSWPPDDWRDVTVVVAVSGGADSVALLCGLHELRGPTGAGRLVVAHFNHRLRAAAEDDAQFVRQLAQRLDVDCDIGVAVELVSSSGGDGLEAQARAARYGFLLQTAQRYGARFIATAHTSDDQAETILHRIIRGTGLAGLAGIPRIRPLSEAVTLIRPLLSVSRDDVAAYLSARRQSYCLDESNEDPSFTRNRIRHALLPQLAAQYNPNVREALLRLGHLAGEAQRVIEKIAGDLATHTVKSGSRQLEIDCLQLLDQPRHLVRELLIFVWKQQNWPQQQMGLQEWDSLATMVFSPLPDKAIQNFPGNIRAERRQDKLFLSKEDS